MAKKFLGQHFLVSREALSRIVRAAAPKMGEAVLEIGPGTGTLTEALLASGARVIAIEKDEEFLPKLAEKFSRQIESGVLSLIGGDFLKIPLDDLALEGEAFAVVANIPYYITGAIVEKILSSPLQPSRAVLLLQKEVARRITDPRKESVLSLSVKAYGAPAIMGAVGRGAFRPAPKVDSAILRIDAISRKNFSSARDEKSFFALLKAGFAHKRKFLARNLEEVSARAAIERAFAALNLSKEARAEDVSLRTWLALTESLKTASG